MKRKNIAFLPIIMAGICLFSGCSCASTIPLTFNNDFYQGNSDPMLGFSQTNTYQVSYDSEGAEYTDADFYNGSYTTVLTVENKGQLDSDIFSVDDNMNNVYHLHTEFSITAKYQGDDNTYNDYVNSDVYFCSYKFSYAPIFSKTQAKYSSVTVKNDGSSVEETTVNTKTTYQKESYEIYTDINGKEETNSYKYDFRTLVDNTQLLFLLQNVGIKSQGSYLLPVVTYNYGKSKNLIIQDVDSNQKAVNLTFNGNNISSVTLQNLSYKIDSIYSSGRAQTVAITQKTDDMPCMLYSYSEPLIAYGKMLTMGNLTYTLSSVVIA